MIKNLTIIAEVITLVGYLVTAVYLWLAYRRGDNGLSRAVALLFVVQGVLHLEGLRLVLTGLPISDLVFFGLHFLLVLAMWYVYHSGRQIARANDEM